MLNVMAALPNIGGALCSTPQSRWCSKVMVVSQSSRSQDQKCSLATAMNARHEMKGVERT